jgi:hypothetical protein
MYLPGICLWKVEENKRKAFVWYPVFRSKLEAGGLRGYSLALKLKTVGREIITWYNWLFHTARCICFWGGQADQSRVGSALQCSSVPSHVTSRHITLILEHRFHYVIPLFKLVEQEKVKWLVSVGRQAFVLLQVQVQVQAQVRVQAQAQAQVQAQVLVQVHVQDL